MGSFWSIALRTETRSVAWGAGALLLAIASAASAQEGDTARPWSIRQNVAPASGVALQPGAAALLHAVQRYTNLRRYSEPLGAALSLSHYDAGMEVALPTPKGSRLKMTADFALGRTRLRSGGLASQLGTTDRVSETYISLRGGVRIEYALATSCHLFVGGQEYYHFDGAGTREAVDAVGYVQPLLAGSWAYPLTLGLRFDLR